MTHAASAPGIARWTRRMALVNAGIAGFGIAVLTAPGDGGAFFAWLLVAAAVLAAIDGWLAAIDESRGRPTSRFNRLMWLLPSIMLLPGLVITIALGFLELVR